MAKVYYDKDADLKFLKGRTIAIIGYGTQGRAQALCLRDSGLNVGFVAEMPGTENYKKAKADGFSPMTAAEAAEKSDFIQMLVPDELQAGVYKQEIEPAMGKGKTLGFSHGFNIHFNQIVAPPDVDVIMVAPKGPGNLVRVQFEEGKGVPALIAIHQDASKKAKQTALAYAKGIGGTRAGVFETTFKEETETDLFGEQAVLCGGVTRLMQAGFDILVEAGYSPEMAYFECIHEMKLIVDLIVEQGFAGMRNAISNTAEYGDLTRGDRVIDECVKDSMRELLDEIQRGEFAREWILENRAGQPVFKALKRMAAEHLSVKTGDTLRAMMPWIKKAKG